EREAVERDAPDDARDWPGCEDRRPEDEALEERDREELPRLDSPREALLRLVVAMGGLLSLLARRKRRRCVGRCRKGPARNERAVRGWRATAILHDGAGIRDP